MRVGARRLAQSGLSPTGARQGWEKRDAVVSVAVLASDKTALPFARARSVRSQRRRRALVGVRRRQRRAPVGEGAGRAAARRVGLAAAVRVGSDGRAVRARSVRVVTVRRTT